ncbi:hypothetical protein DPSP01_003843 [Paraphaeosphaeria sporulosa]|uniref:AA1-like domain-containing protein n=1 Tax=Paraphaeosphaeria sporulosa TaxID=1460663 RepID=A0A177C836_9PLEO|nr:uncharacterized protein CC84DRAFT_1250895 [Paraphaeosphaeria sporulosa]OAG02917.1 hypothetical protein CC84DRAFT_1250895 [Paraphaeosphaeria sporulosa]
MKPSTISSILTLAVTTFATAIPAPAAHSDITLRDTPDITYTIPSTELSALSTQLIGVSGTLQLNFVNGNTIKSWYSVTDTKGDSHSVYMTTVVYDGKDDVLRCNNKLGHDHTQVCGWREYHRNKRISYIAPKWCVNIQGGPDKCVTGPKFQNPRL